MIMGFIDQMRVEGHVSRVGLPGPARAGLPDRWLSIYRSWRTQQVAARTVSDATVMDAVRTRAWTTDHRGRVRLAPEGLYERAKMLALLRRTGHPDATPGAVDRAMRTLGLSGVRRGKPVRTTVPGKDGRRAGDLLNRDFTAPAPNMVWVTDFTYVRIWSGFVYVSFIVDVFAQRIVAWHAQTPKHTSLVMTPLRMAIWQRDHEGYPLKPGQLVHHSDAGSLRFIEHLALEGIASSIGTVGDAYDNALMESINGLHKAECIRTKVFHDGAYKTLSDVEYATASWVQWYNHDRLHSTLGYLTPVEFENAHYTSLIHEGHPV